MDILKKISQNGAILISERGKEIQPIEQPKQLNNTPSVPGSVPPLDFSQIEFPLMEVVNQSQIDSPRISDTFQPKENSNSSKEAPPSTDLTLKSKEIQTSDEEMRETGDLNVSAKPPQSTRDFSTIPISNSVSVPIAKQFLTINEKWVLVKFMKALGTFCV